MRGMEMSVGFARLAMRVGVLAVLGGIGMIGHALAADVTISFWNNWDGNRAPQLRTLLDEFERENPGIKVENVTLTNDTTTERMLAAVASGSVPDLYMSSATATTKWASLDALTPLDPYVARDKLDLAKLFYQGGIDASTYTGKLIQLPYKAPTSLAIWFNKDLFRAAGLDPNAPPRTWKELEDAATKLTKRNGEVITQLGLNICIVCSMGPENAYIEWLSRNNGLLLTPDGKDVAFDRPEGVQTLQWMVDFSKRTVGSWSAAVRQFGVAYKDMRPAFYAGKVAMTMDGPYLYNIMSSDAPTMLDKVGVFLTPINGDNPAAKERFLAYGTPGYAIPRGAKHPDEAWKLLKFIAIADKGACAFFTMQNRPDSPLKDCKAGPNTPVANTLMANMAIVQAAIAPGPMPQILTRIQQMQEGALLGNETPEQAVKNAARDIRQIIADQ